MVINIVVALGTCFARIKWEVTGGYQKKIFFVNLQCQFACISMSNSDPGSYGCALKTLDIEKV